MLIQLNYLNHFQTFLIARKIFIPILKRSFIISHEIRLQKMVEVKEIRIIITCIINVDIFLNSELFCILKEMKIYYLCTPLYLSVNYIAINNN